MGHRRLTRVATLLAAVFVLAAPAAGQDLSRADPGLRFLWMQRGRLAASPVPIEREPRPGIRPSAAAPQLAPALDRTGRVRTLVRVGPGGERALRDAGATLGARAGDIVTARVPMDALPALLADPSIRALEAATPLRPATLLSAANDSANADSDFDALRSRAGERWEGLAGSGVIIGVYDSGLDLTHDDFLRPDGGTRVLYAWDQTAAGAGPGAVGPHLLDYGFECTGVQIDEGDCSMRDRVGHGTHVAGTAAGDGSATGRDMPAWRFPGGAPAADLIVVKGGDGAYDGDLLVEGVAYIFARAEALGRPAVVNVSLSSQSGPHDGTTLLEEALDALSGPGRIVVSGSGNAGDHRNASPPAINGPSHAEGTGGRGSHAVRIPEYRPTEGAVNDFLLVELWYDGRDSLAITVRTPGGAALRVATGDSATLETDAGTITAMNAVDGPAVGNGDHGAIIGIVDLDAALPPDTGRWAIDVEPVAVHGDGVYHLWLTGHTFDTPILPRLEGGTTNRVLVGVPASADRVLAAGAHVTRHEWLGVDGQPRSFPAQEPLGDIAYFSSPGPRRDGVSKPDVTAPGKVLISSLSRDATLWDEFPWLVEADSVHVGLLGTSTASPQLTAAVAVLLQLEPGLTPEDARDALRLAARSDAFVPASLPDPAWGAGKLDVAAAAERLRPAGLPTGGADVALSENPVRDDGLVISYRERPRSVAVYTLAGERVRGFGDDEIGPLTVVWALDTDEGGDVANGVYVLVVELPGERILRKILVARP